MDHHTIPPHHTTTPHHHTTPPSTYGGPNFYNVLVVTHYKVSGESDYNNILFRDEKCSIFYSRSSFILCQISFESVQPFVPD